MIFSLLADANNTTGNGGTGNNWYMYVVIGVVVLLLVGWLFLSGRKNKRRQNEYVEQLNAIAPGHKVKTAGGICGIVVEVCDDNTVIIETGSEQSGKSYIKMDKELIAQTDAKGPTQIAREEAEARRKAEKEGKANGAEVKEAPAEVPAEEAPAAEAPAEEAQPVEASEAAASAEEEPKKSAKKK